MKLRILLVLPLLFLLSGCGKYSYKTAYQVDVAQQKEVSLRYYDTIDKVTAARKDVADKLAEACITVGEQIGKDLAPDEAVVNRTETAVTGSGKTFDVSTHTPPESLLSLAVERRKMVLAVAYAIQRVAADTRVDVAAPAGSVHPSAAPASAEFDLPDDADIDSAMRNDLPSPVPPVTIPVSPSG